MKTAGKTNTSVSVDDDFKDELAAEGKKLGLGWTTMLLVMAREGLQIRKLERERATK